MYSQSEINIRRETCRSEAEQYSKNVELYIRDCVSPFEAEKYTYYPSNFYQNAINALQAELNAATRGDYTISQEYRQEIEDRLTECVEKRNRVQSYETQQGLNSDGTKKN